MKVIFAKGLFVIATLLALIFLSNSVTANVKATREQLKNVDQAITQAKESISARKNRLNKVQNELEKTEKTMGHWYTELAKTKQSLNQTDKTISELQAQLNQLNEERENQYKALGTQIKAQYMVSEKHPLKNLFNNENQANIDRLNKYAEILAKRRLDILTALQQTEEQVSEKKIALQTEKNKLTELHDQQQQAHKKLHDQLQQRQKLITEIDHNIAQQEINLHNLVENKKQLQTVMQRLQRSSNYSGQNISTHKRHLPWPITGKIISQYGQPVKNSELKTSGIVISGKYGNIVRAIAPGKVVFADWMPGLGFMLIIDHGQSYMSLYGHNQRLLLSVGDVVKEGDDICTVGDTGGQPQPGLYFGIRHHGKPINPTDWLS